jgi:hypothetical protein
MISKPVFIVFAVSNVVFARSYNHAEFHDRILSSAVAQVNRSSIAATSRTSLTLSVRGGTGLPLCGSQPESRT